MNSLGMTPPTISFSKATLSVKSRPCFFGLSCGEGFEGDHAVTELTATAGLLLVQAADVSNFLADCFAVRDLGLARLDVDLHVADEFVADDFEVQLAHAHDDGLACFFVELAAEARVFNGG